MQMPKETLTIELPVSMKAALFDAGKNMIPSDFADLIPEKDQLNYIVTRLLDRSIRLTAGQRRGGAANKKKFESAKTKKKEPESEASIYGTKGVENARQWFLRVIPIYLKGRGLMKASDITADLIEKHETYGGPGNSYRSTGISALATLRNNKVINQVKTPNSSETWYELK
jgi:hypothetical protein